MKIHREEDIVKVDDTIILTCGPLEPGVNLSWGFESDAINGSSAELFSDLQTVIKPNITLNASGRYTCKTFQDSDTWEKGLILVVQNVLENTGTGAQKSSFNNLSSYVSATVVVIVLVALAAGFGLKYWQKRKELKTQGK